MPKMSSYQSGSTTKAILLGHSGGGKSGALCSLATAGYHLHILDTDNGLDIVKNLFLQEGSPYPAKYIDNIDYITITEKMKPSPMGTLIPAQAKAWDKCISLFDKWRDPEPGGVDLGSVFSWGPEDVLVIDSFTMMCNFAMNKVLSMNARLGAQPYQSDWGEAQRMVEAVLQTLYDVQLRCNVIVCCHIVMLGPEGAERGFPNSLGKALSPKIGRYFNTALLCEGGKIHTKTRGLVDLKNTNPGAVLPSYPLETGLADYFKAVRKAPAAPVAKIEGPKV